MLSKNHFSFYTALLAAISAYFFKQHFYWNDSFLAYIIFFNLYLCLCVSHSLYIYICMCVCVYVCVCVCIYTYTYIKIYIYMCVCVCAYIYIYIYVSLFYLKIVFLTKDMKLLIMRLNEVMSKQFIYFRFYLALQASFWAFFWFILIC